jgi:hypothetical protein
MKRSNRKNSPETISLGLTSSSHVPQAVDNTIKFTDSNQLRDFDSPNSQLKTSRLVFLKSKLKKKFLYPITGIALLALIGMGVMAKNGWLPATDALTGKKTGWFGAALPRNAASSWNPLANPLPTPTPQLSKEYIYAGSRLLAVEDANANAAPPADLAIWRPSSGQWWVMGGTGSTQTTIQWGANGDKTVPGDYDGDGKTDFSIYRPSVGTWYIVNSSAGDQTTTITGFGAAGDLAAPADFDGDGKTDAAIYRPSEGKWYIKQSSGVVLYINFGVSSDTPAPADYDGDGKADIAVWRSGNWTFYVLRSSDGSLQYSTLGQSSAAIPVPADYDGDGKADMAVRSGNNWIIRRSSDNQVENLAPSWETSSDKEVPNDYDGDGKVDIAVWRPSNGNWYIRQSSKLGQTSELRQVQWGMQDDFPVPAFYRR